MKKIKYTQYMPLPEVWDVIETILSTTQVTQPMQNYSAPECQKCNRKTIEFKTGQISNSLKKL